MMTRCVTWMSLVLFSLFFTPRIHLVSALGLLHIFFSFFRKGRNSKVACFSRFQITPFWKVVANFSREGTRIERTHSAAQKGMWFGRREIEVSSSSTDGCFLSRFLCCYKLICFCLINCFRNYLMDRPHFRISTFFPLFSLALFLTYVYFSSSPLRFSLCY